MIKKTHVFEFSCFYIILIIFTSRCTPKSIENICRLWLHCGSQSFERDIIIILVRAAVTTHSNLQEGIHWCWLLHGRKGWRALLNTWDCSHIFPYLPPSCIILPPLSVGGLMVVKALWQYWSIYSCLTEGENSIAATKGKPFWLCLLGFRPQCCKQALALTHGPGRQSKKLPGLLLVSYLWAADSCSWLPGKS